ncbi:unnamed protein product [Schistosoma mattheei]|uniref:Uncharacterized protein n=1 Tax=Schistosoma mattheei TaxID=31246 RepID=A0A3P8EIG7_9TREM|nr:unnamed protein product [Schistosoma mattheei]
MGSISICNSNANTITTDINATSITIIAFSTIHSFITVKGTDIFIISSISSSNSSIICIVVCIHLCNMN